MNHPSNNIPREAVEDIQTLEDVKRVFPDLNWTINPKDYTFSADTARELRTPESLTRQHIQFARDFNPYTFERWRWIWARQRHAERKMEERTESAPPACGSAPGGSELQTGFGPVVKSDP